MWYSPQEIAEWQARGAVGYKIWIGVSPLADDPANDATFLKMEQIEFIGASIHVSQPYPTNQPLREKVEITAERYHRCFEILETDKIVRAGFYPGPGAGTKEVKGMALPIDVLEKIYYKNAARLYPRVKDVLKQMGYACQ